LSSTTRMRVSVLVMRQVELMVNNGYVKHCKNLSGLVI
jgi:hypothetical protein